MTIPPSYWFLAGIAVLLALLIAYYFGWIMVFYVWIGSMIGLILILILGQIVSNHRK